ncbi:DUF3375 family protein [Ornithinimicrobium sp. W1665]|uniref:DUF3375 family protein n=1 Tax=Ornithinimicrobium sp. W1665 TaxID=3416666 RepID=UPI003D6AD474
MPGVEISLPFERPLYDARPVAEVDSVLDLQAEAQVDLSVLLGQTFVDQARLADHIRSIVPPASTVLLEDIVDFYPVEQGAAEIVGYLALSDDDLEVVMDETQESVIEYADSTGRRRARLPRVTVRRR